MTDREPLLTIHQPPAVSRRAHGHTKNGRRSPTMSSWNSMMQRCLNPRATDFYLYGGRGITVCARWRSFANFLADMGERPTGKSLDRLDPNGDYTPTNTRWATSQEQTSNRRDSRFVEWRGRKLILRDWSRELGIATNTLFSRLAAGWPVERAFTTPVYRPMDAAEMAEIRKLRTEGMPVYRLASRFHRTHHTINAMLRARP